MNEQLDLIEKALAEFSPFSGEEDSILEEISNMTLPPLPTSDDQIHTIFSLYNVVQSFSTRLSELYIKALHYKRALEIAKFRIESLYEREKALILTNTEELAAYKNQEQRNAYVDRKLSRIIRLKQIAEEKHLLLQGVISIINEKRNDLANYNLNLSRQQRIVELLLENGLIIFETKNPKELQK